MGLKDKLFLKSVKSLSQPVFPRLRVFQDTFVI